jgi:hypothetical protein
VNARPVASVADVRKVRAASIQQLSINFEKWLSEGNLKACFVLLSKIEEIFKSIKDCKRAFLAKRTQFANLESKS